MKMTEEQMLERMKEIDEELTKLHIEESQYKDYFREKEYNEKLKKREKYIGKCFVSKNLSNNKMKEVTAFKILDFVKGVAFKNYATCIALIWDRNSIINKGYGVKIVTLQIWGDVYEKITSKTPDCQIIDFYEEISQEDFKELYLEHLDYIDEKVFGLFEI